MYPRNAASPEPIAIGPVVAIADGAVQTSGCTVRIKPIGVAEGDGGGTTAYSTDGIVLYTPTQAETNYTSFILIAKKTACIPVAITVITSESAVAGRTSVGMVNGVVQTSDFNTIAGYLDTEVAAILAAVDTEIAAIKAKTDLLNFTGTSVQADVVDWKGSTAPAMTGDAFARLGLPAGASTAADIAALLTAVQAINAAFIRGAVGLASANLDTQLGAIAGVVDTEVAAILAAVDTEVAAIKAKTDQLTFTVANVVDANTTHFGGSAGSFTAGRPQVDSELVKRRGTAQAGTTSTITLDAGASSIMQAYKGDLIVIVGGTGAGQKTTMISSYDGATRMATIHDTWTVIPDNTSVFSILASDVVFGVYTSVSADVSAINGDNVDVYIRAALGLAAANLDTQLSTLTGLVDTEIAAILAAVDTEVAAIKAKTDQMNFTGAAYIQADVVDWKGATAPAMTGDAYAAVQALNNLSQANVRAAVGLAAANLDTQLSTITGAIDTEVSAILAAVDTEVASIKTKTDQFVFTNAGKVDASLLAAADIAAAVCNKLADHVARRSQGDIETSADGDAKTLNSLYGMIQQIQKSAVAGGTLTVKDPSGSTLGTLPITADAAADPIVSVGA